MADEYDYDVDEFDYEDGWMYVEDEYGLADELAELQIPEPGYSGTNNEIDMDEYEYDFYDFWIDAEYGEDPYWDQEDARRTILASSGKSGQKRKRVLDSKPPAKDKRRKLTGRTQQPMSVPPGGVIDNVVFISQEGRYKRATAKPAPAKDLKRYSLLPDWRMRFAHADGEVKVVHMPRDMMQAAEAVDDDAPGGGRPSGEGRPSGIEIMEGDEEEGDWEGEDAGDDEEPGLSLDPQMLKTVLRQRLREAGLEGMDEGAFMASIEKLLSGEAADDDSTAQLAEMLLGTATNGGGNSAVSGWLAHQGVALDEDEDETSSVATAELPETTKVLPAKRNAIMSPSDSGVSGLDSSSQAAGPSKEMALHPVSPKAQHNKRPRKKVSFDIPRTKEEDEEFGTSHELAASLPTSQDDVPRVAVTAARAVQSKVASARANAAVKGRVTPGAQLQDELAVQADVAAAAPIRQTRKRKAADGSDIAGDVAELGKRAVKEPATRKTRSARARSEK